jgi:hypothetical protein
MQNQLLINGELVTGEGKNSRCITPPPEKSAGDC